MRRSALMLVLVLAVGWTCTAAELTGYGFQFSLSLESISEEGAVQWWVTAGLYADIVFDEVWEARVSAGSRVTDFNPFGRVFLARVFTPELALMGDLYFQSFPQQGMKATARVGGRYQTGEPPDTMHIEAMMFPVGWRLTSFNRNLRGDLFFSANVSADVTMGSPEVALFGAKLALALIPEPRGGTGRAIPIGEGLLLAPELLIHLGIGD